MPDPVRLILGFRAAGLLVVGLTLPLILQTLARVFLHDEVLGLRHGSDSIIAAVMTLLSAAVETLWWGGS
jgi:hypothetical protein